MNLLMELNREGMTVVMVTHSEENPLLRLPEKVVPLFPRKSNGIWIESD